MTELIHTLGIIDLLATPIGVVALLAYGVSRHEAMGAAFVGLLVAGFVGGLALGGLLLGLAALLRYGYTVARSQDRGASIWGGAEEAGDLASGAARMGGGRGEDDPLLTGAFREDPAMRETLLLLREIRDLTVLPQEERAAVSDRVRSNHKRRAAEAVVNSLNMRQVARARELLSQAESVYGATPIFEKLAEKIAEADARHEPLDFNRARRFVEEAVADGNWALAEQCAHAAWAEHPESGRCRKLWDDTRRARLHAHVQDCATNHNWSEALSAAEEFLERFPDSPEADAIRPQLATLRSNLEISTRKQYEHRFKELIGGRQYGEALRIARHVVEHFPGSPQAAALQQQMPALERRAAG